MKIFVMFLLIINFQMVFACTVDYEQIEHFNKLKKNPETAALAVIVSIVESNGKRSLVVEKAFTPHQKIYNLNDDSFCKFYADPKKKFLFLSEVNMANTSEKSFRGFDSANGILLDVAENQTMIKKLNQRLKPARKR